MAAAPMNGSSKSRTHIEANVTKLRKALQHWQTLEIDYEGIKDEIQGLPENTTTKTQLFEAASEFGPEKLDEKDLTDLFQVNDKLRKPSQIIELLTKRTEYVRKNIDALRKQLTDLEKERNAILLAGNQEQEPLESGTDLRPADITEQLDEDDNVISSHVQRANDTFTGDGAIGNQSARPVLQQASASQTKSDNVVSTQIPKEQSVTSIDTEPHPTADEAPLKDGTSSTLHPINPEDTEEEALLRQDMLQYGLPEVGNIVAELEMAEADDGFDDEDDGELDDLDDEYDDSEDDESEDEYGRSTQPVMSDKYRKKMEQLQKDLGLSMENVGPSTAMGPENLELADRPAAAEAARKAALARYEAAQSAIKSNESESELVKERPRKKVAFAHSLDIASNSPTDTTNGQSTKISRFKAARSSQPQTPLLPPPMDFPQTTAKRTPEGPSGRTVVETLVERPRKQTEEDEPPAPPDDEDFDEELQKKQIALEHHRLRNKKIHEQGGYVGGGELDNWGEEHAAPTILDEKTGQPRKVSRFKAARLKS